MKFLEAIEHYKKEMGLKEAIPGSTPVTTPAATPGIPPTPPAPATSGAVDFSKLSPDEQAQRHMKAVQTVQGVMDKIKAGTAKAEDYTTLSSATTDMNALQAVQATKPGAPATPGATSAAAAPSNPLVKPLV